MLRKDRLKKFISGLTVVIFVSVLLVTFSPAPAAEAFEGGSGSGSSGGGGGGGNPTGGWRWRVANSLSEIGGLGAHGGAQAYANGGSNPNLYSICTSPDLVRIYWISGKNDNWAKMFNSNGLAQPWTWPGGGDAIDQFAVGLNYGGTYLICVINSVERKSTTEYQHRNLTDATSVSAPYTWTTQVAPQIVNAAGEDPIGLNNLNAQGTSEKGAFGNIYDTIAGSGAGDYSSQLSSINNAVANDRNREHAALTLNANNQAGLGEGGVLNVSEFTRNATLALSQAWSETRSRTVTCDYRSGTWNLANPANCSYGAWSAWSEDSGSRNYSITKNMGTQPNSGFWQLLSVHCNLAQLNALKDALAAAGRPVTTLEQTNHDDGTVTAIIRTPVFSPSLVSGTSSWAPARPAVLDFGDTTNPNSELAASGYVGFYDKECVTNCTTAPTGPGASTANGATGNASNTTTLTSKGSFGGAVLRDSQAREEGNTSPSTNSNYLEVFRDNSQSRTVRVNTAYPVVAGTNFNYNGGAPFTTTVNIWGMSTPDTNPANGQFFMTATDITNRVGTGTTEKLFDGRVGSSIWTNDLSTPPGAQKNFGNDPYSTGNSETFSGFSDTFQIGATWASEVDRPVVLNIKWEYRPTTVVTVPSNIGFGPTGTGGFSSPQLRVYSSTDVTQALDVRCYAQYGINDSLNNNLVDLTQQNTGTGSTNNLDAGLISSANGDNSFLEPNNLVIKFIRGVSE